MQIIKCDRCGKELDRFERRHAQVNVYGDYYLLAKDRDFCSTCRKEVEDAFSAAHKRFLDWIYKKNGVDKLWPL